MEGRERDSTQDWLISEGSAPPLLEELEERIDEALAIAREAGETVESVGAAALDAAEHSRLAAEQACRAAELAEHASSAMREQQRAAEVAPSAAPAPGADPHAGSRADGSATPVADDSLRSFTERADRIVARLRELERLPAAPGVRPLR